MPQLRPQLRTPSTRVLLLVLGMCLASVLLWTVSPMSPLTRVEQAAWALTLPWWVLVLLFVAAELFVFHLQYRREAKSVSASEIPLVLGLQLAAPGGMLPSRLLGGLLWYVVHRRQTPLKVGFNLALLLLDTTVAVMVFDLVADGARPLLDARGWGASVAAAVAAAALDALLLSRVISWYDKEYDVRRAAGDVWFSARMAALVATVQAIEPTSWQSGGGPGTIVFDPARMALIVKQ